MPSNQPRTGKSALPSTFRHPYPLARRLPSVSGLRLWRVMNDGLARGTLRAILHQAGLSPEQFEELRPDHPEQRACAAHDFTIYVQR